MVLSGATNKLMTLTLAGASALLAQGPARGPAAGMPFNGMEHRVMSPQVKGAPYSAQEVTESTQTLADGSHIKRTTTTQIYRDVDGRVRLERTVTRPGEASRKAVTIIDPVAGAQYEINTEAKTAHKMNFHARSGPATALTSGPNSATTGAAPQVRASRMRTSGAANDGTARIAEPLGHQSFDGVDGEGTRTTMTIAPNTIGNEAPLQVITERWYSADLHTLLMSRHVDPRQGETVYRLTNINRSNPDASLFQVPSDIQVTEGGPKGGPRGSFNGRRPVQQ